MIKLLPPWFDQIAAIEIDNRSSFVLNNGSEIKASATSIDAGRSEALSLLVIDEAAHVENLDELWTALQPTMAAGGRCIALSSPNGVGNWFHKTYIASQTGENDFHPTKLHWTLHPERDKNWFEETTRNLSRRKIAQEYECNFNASGETVIHPDNLEKLAGVCTSPKHQTGFDRNFWIWEEYKPENKYLLVGDVARGDGNDYSVFHIFNTKARWNKWRNIAESLRPIYSHESYSTQEKNTETPCSLSKTITSASQFWKNSLMPVIQIYITLLKELTNILNNMRHRICPTLFQALQLHKKHVL